MLQETAKAEIDDETLYAKDDDLLPRSVEYELVRRWQENGDNRARGKLLESYRRLAESCAQRYARNGLALSRASRTNVSAPGPPSRRARAGSSPWRSARLGSPCEPLPEGFSSEAVS